MENKNTHQEVETKSKIGHKFMTFYTWNVSFVNMVIVKNDQITPKHHVKSFHSPPTPCVHPTTCNMAAILNGMQPNLQCISVTWKELLGRTPKCTWLDIHAIVNKIIDTCQIKVSADQYHVTILWAQVYSSLRSHALLKWTAGQVLVFDWIAGSCQVNLLKTELGGSEAC